MGWLTNDGGNVVGGRRDGETATDQGLDSGSKALRLWGWRSFEGFWAVNFVRPTLRLNNVYQPTVTPR